MTKLLPCPFCGSDPVMVSLRRRDQRPNKFAVHCGCPANAGTDWIERVEDAWAIWEGRSLTAALAIPEIAAMREALEDGDPQIPEFLEWVAARLVHQHGEPKNVDFVLALERHAANIRAALAALEGKGHE